jgi:hypothetical protein
MKFKEPSIISGTGAATWSKTNFGPTGHALKVVPFCAYALFPAILPFIKCIMEVMFCEGVHHHLHLNCVKMAAFEFHLQLREQRKVGWMGDGSRVVFGQQFPGKKESVS